MFMFAFFKLLLQKLWRHCNMSIFPIVGSDLCRLAPTFLRRQIRSHTHVLQILVWGAVHLCTERQEADSSCLQSLVRILKLIKLALVSLQMSSILFCNCA
jgi:hypothetical protein